MRLPRWVVLGMCMTGAFCTSRDGATLRAAPQTPDAAHAPVPPPVAQSPATPSRGALPSAPPTSVPQPATAAPAEPQKTEPSTSVGSPTNGSLRAGAALPMRGPGFHFNDKRSSDARYGTDEVVAAIARAAQVVQAELPGGELVVNDLSLPRGGAIPHHGSHRAGRDADILFYLEDSEHRPTPSVGAPLDAEGVGFDFKDLHDPADDVRVQLDVARTWRFIAALLSDERATVQRVFVVEHVRALLLSEARRQQAPGALITRFEEVTCQPSYPHDDHLHVRWFCSAEDISAGCEESAPVYPWQLSTLAAAGITPVLARATHAREPAPVTTQAEANRAVAAAAPDAAVLAFLKRRKAWEKQPHPGRPYCR